MDVAQNSTEEVGQDAPPPPSFGRRALGWLGETAIILVGAVIIATLLRSFVGQMFIIPTGSMENTLQVNDRVLVAKFGGFQRGDVVVFRDPGDWLRSEPQEPNAVRQALEFVGVLPDSSKEHLIKRVIGMPGDHVRVNDEGLLEVNGQALEESAYLFSQDGVQVAPANVPFDVVVPAGHIFVMGDHRNASSDSRCQLTQTGRDGGQDAFVPVENVVGAAVAIVSPLDRLATFQVPQTFAQVPAPTEPAPEKGVLNHVESGC